MTKQQIEKLQQLQHQGYLIMPNLGEGANKGNCILSHWLNHIIADKFDNPQVLEHVPVTYFSVYLDKTAQALSGFHEQANAAVKESHEPSTNLQAA